MNCSLRCQPTFGVSWDLDVPRFRGAKSVFNRLKTLFGNVSSTVISCQLSVVSIMPAPHAFSSPRAKIPSLMLPIERSLEDLKHSSEVDQVSLLVLSQGMVS